MGEPLVQVVLLYILFIVLITILFGLLRKVFKNRIVIFCYVFILISPFLLYIPVEVNTFLYGKEFKDVEIDTGLNYPVVYYKVFSISKNEAELFFVEGENGYHEVGNFYYFVKENGKWKFNRWGRTMWTNYGGSASEFTVPPYF
ncbi:hypothetical protein [Acetivibrio cellulolyticus]|uniref:hypothetical protein n=1 Tax=Acetivibrio cellulolyticus TaxID=35830 RepID=UPI0001E2C7E4|nr:hypothetical protein [Acetivibrio cellulolyticus]